MKPIYYHPEATQEFDSSALYYEQQRAGLGERFQEVVFSAEETVSRNPKIGIKTFYGAGSIRKYHLSYFPFNLFYCEQPDAIWILAVAHDSRKPGYWTERIG